MNYVVLEDLLAVGKQDELAEFPPSSEAEENDAARPKMWPIYH